VEFRSLKEYYCTHFEGGVEKSRFEVESPPSGTRWGKQ